MFRIHFNCSVPTKMKNTVELTQSYRKKAQHTLQEYSQTSKWLSGVFDNHYIRMIPKILKLIQMSHDSRSSIEADSREVKIPGSSLHQFFQIDKRHLLIQTIKCIPEQICFCLMSQKSIRFYCNKILKMN